MTTAKAVIDKHVSWDSPDSSPDGYARLKADLRFLADKLDDGDAQDQWFAQELRGLIDQQ